MKIVEIANTYVGTKEGTARHHALIEEYNTLLAGKVGYRMSYTDPWCAAYASLCAAKAGDNLPLAVNVEVMVQAAKMAGTWTNVPAPGYYIVYDWDGNHTGDHVGIVTSVDRWSVESVEGNRSDSVKQVRNSIDSPYIMGYIRPADVPAGKDIEIPATLPQIKQGDKGDAVKALQTILRLRGYDLGSYGVDGDAGRWTISAVHKYNWDRLGNDSYVADSRTWYGLIYNV